MTVFLLPCTCSAVVPVTAGQAGGRVACPACGREIAVPKLRDLADLPRQDTVGRAPVAAWRPAQAVALLGSIVAAGAFFAAAWMTPRGSGVLDEKAERALRAAVLSADDLTVYRVWSDGLARVGVRRPPLDEELRLLREVRFADGVRSVLHVVAAGGALVAAAAGCMLISGSRSAAEAVSAADSGRGRR